MRPSQILFPMSSTLYGYWIWIAKARAIRGPRSIRISWPETYPQRRTMAARNNTSTRAIPHSGQYIQDRRAALGSIDSRGGLQPSATYLNKEFPCGGRYIRLH